MASPIDTLKRYIPNAIINIAPERRKEFKSEFGTGIELDCDDSNRVWIDLNRPRITFGTRYLEALWVRAYAYWCIFDEIQQKHPAHIELFELDLRDSPRTQEAGDLLAWAVNRDLGKLVTGWPAQLPKPIADPTKDSDHNMADHLFLVAIAFLALHELMHLKLKHDPALSGADAVMQQREADYEAAEWVLRNASDDRAFVKRALGIGLAFLSLMSREIYVGPEGWPTHPPGYDRLYYTLEREIDEEHAVVWWFAETALRLHLCNYDVDFDDDRQFDTAKEAVNYLCNVISKINDT